MKKFVLFVSASVLAVSSLLYSCKKEEFIISKSENNVSSKSSARHSNVHLTGSYHNRVLSEIENKLDFTINPDSVSISRVADTVLKYSEIVMQTSINYSFNYQEFQGFYNNPDSSMTSLRYEESKIGFVTQRENTILDNSLNEFERYRNSNHSSTYDSIIAIADKYIAICDTISWNRAEGDLVTGYLQIMKHSAEFWKDYDFEKAGLEEPSPFVLVQLDAFVYAFTWTTLVIQEYKAGTLNPDGQWDRITKAATAAVLASTCKGWGTNLPLL